MAVSPITAIDGCPAPATVAPADSLPPSPPLTARPSRKNSLGDSASDTSQTSKPYPLPPKNAPKSVLVEDFKTPDRHVERDSRLIRLTGVHPFNVEPPLTDLYDEGFLTSENLHYVRNHGLVPVCEDSEILDWSFTVEGMVSNPITMSVRDLIEDHVQQTYPITLVCAGNRRKEQNMVRKSKGFSWGAAGLATALWTGVPIADLLKRAKPLRGARYVCFEGADKLPNGYYGTSVKLNWCLDPNRGILVAHKMNGDTLHPDHGKPVRIVIPGQIGGRSVKWLKKIIVTQDPSDNWYHIYDNRVLPTNISPEASAELPEVWKDESYAIYDLNANSAICYPQHDEIVPLKSEASTYTFRGYAYAGGGKRITRMEMTLDKGKTWRLANMRYPEDDYRLASEGETLYGGEVDITWREASFCWSFWDLEVPIKDLANADDVMVRAMDEGMMVQPRDMYWSVLGMMNNPWFRLVIHREGHSLRFEHPTQPALMPGGWMERVKKAGGNLSNGFWGEKMGTEDDQVAAVQEPEKEICMTRADVKRVITPEELEAHDNDKEPWFVVDGQVYDGTTFLDGHPGGAASIFGVAGQEATEEFMTIHSENAKAMMPEYHIGTLSGSLAEKEESADPSRAVFLQSKSWVKATLSTRESVSHDSKIFSFRLDHDQQQIGLPTGQHLLIRLRDPATREAIIRAYTPLSEVDEKGKLRILIKIYKDNGDKKGGKMTQALDAIPLGHFVEFKGPVGKFEYLSKGLCRISGRERQVRRFYMICGGSGITPIYQVLRAVAQDATDPTECRLLDGNRVEQDILLRTELHQMAGTTSGRCRILYTLTQPEESWVGGRGRVDKALLQEEVGSRRGDDDEMVLVCGPEAMEKSVKEILLNMGWAEDDMVFF